MPLISEQQRLTRVARQWVKTFPDLYATAKAAAGDIIRKHTGRQLDPDTLWWHRFDSAVSSPYSYTGWEHRGPPLQSLTFVELMLQRFAVSDQDSLDNLQVMGGFYTDGPNHGLFDQHNEVRMLAADVARDFWAIDFATRYTDTLRAFWQHQGDDFIRLGRARLLAEVRKARAARQLSADDLQMIEQGLAGRLNGPLTVAALGLPSPAQGQVALYTFNLGTFSAQDVLRLSNAHGRQVLYLPGETPSLQAFDDITMLYRWVRQQLADKTSRQAMLKHFTAFAKLERYQLDALAALFDQVSDDPNTQHLGLLLQYTEHIEGDGFYYLRDKAKAQMEHQAQVLLESNAHLRAQLWIGYLGAFIKLASPAAPLSWPLALAVIGAGVTNVVLNSREAMHATTAQKRREAIINAVESAIIVAFSLPFAFSSEAGELEALPGPPLERDLELAPLGAAEGADTAPLADATPMLRAGERFNRLGMIERSDYHRLYVVREIARTENPARSLHDGFAPTRTFSWARKMMPGRMLRAFASRDGARAFAQAQFAGPYAAYEIDAEGLSVASLRHNLQYNTRFTLSREGMPEDFLMQHLRGQATLEDIGAGAWLYDEVHVPLDDLDTTQARLLSMSEFEPVEPGPSTGNTGVLRGVQVREPFGSHPVRTYMIDAEGYSQQVRYDIDTDSWRNSDGEAFRVGPDGKTFLRLDARNPVPKPSVQDMERALGEMGLHARMPLQLAALDRTGALAIPRKLHSIWIGRHMPARFIRRVINNATMAADGSDPFATHLYLSISDAQELERTLARLAGRPSCLHVHLLEDAPFFSQFKAGPFYNQFRAASLGDGHNYASAVDILRYQLLRFEGGIYMDVDDFVRTPIGDSPGMGDVQLHARPGELLLNNLVHHQRLGMLADFNNSNFGSLPDNPLLDRISEESLRRFMANRDLYRARPYDYLNTEEEMSQYGRRIYHVTGPGVFNDVIERELPALRQYRALGRLARGELYFSEQALLQLRFMLKDGARSYSPLQALLGIGSTGSWLHTR
ncbi:hypothetical protein G3436_02610 [Pseudomonas sp. MAFF212427]|uniref:Dermonecrotic toxin N-terminal domain-containing protein n=3 Tax=Pseudomonas brassicae TaxID=2708063 RepID=A0A6B3NRV3_9PSED|nr:DUF6543 domain-containing protein [Pseudomonas brassicae]NER62990.1 hypothetical protein [Pseudomonas brassicae]